MSISIIVDEQEFLRKLRDAFKNQMNHTLRASAPGIKVDLANTIFSLLSASDTYQQLVSGGDNSLRAEFGLSNPQSKLNEIVTIIQRSVEVFIEQVRFVGDQISGGLRVGIVKGDYSDILGSPAASYMSNQFLVEWLKWLLTAGDAIIVANYQIKYNLSNSEKIRSRSGVALMELGSGWKVPSGYSGVADDNWLTKTLGSTAAQTQISEVIKKNIYANLT